MILLAMVVIGILLYLLDVFYYRKHKKYIGSGMDRSAPGSTENANGAPLPENGMENAAAEGEPKNSDGGDDGGICCGMHTVCEKTNLSPLTGEVVYYDDEELDRFRGRQADDYSAEEIEEFRDVLLTLLPEDVAGWSRSIQVRGITLPTEVREELLMIVAELRGV